MSIALLRKKLDAYLIVYLKDIWIYNNKKNHATSV